MQLLFVHMYLNNQRNCQFKKMNFLIFSDLFFPDNRLITQEISLLCNKLNSGKNKVTLATYHLADKKLDQKVDKKELKKGILVIRAGIRNIKRFSSLLRGIFEIINPLALLVKSIVQFVRSDSILVFSPSIFLAFFVIVFSKIFRKIVILNVQDISPQNAIDIGLITNKIAIGILKKIERMNYYFSNKIIVNTFESENYLITERRIPSKKIKVFYPWINHINLKQDNNLTKKEFGIKFNLPLSNSDFIIVFTGTIGPYQDLNMLLDMSKFLQDTNIKFLIFGIGIYKKTLQERVERNGIKNIYFHNAIYGKDFSNLLKISNIGLATLDTRNTTGPIPGKIITYMSNKLPILALVNEDHKDINKIFRSANCGLLLDPNSGAKTNAARLKKLLRMGKELQVMAQSAFYFSINNFDHHKILPKYIEFISEE